MFVTITCLHIRLVQIVLVPLLKAAVRDVLAVVHYNKKSSLVAILHVAFNMIVKIQLFALLNSIVKMYPQ